MHKVKLIVIRHNQKHIIIHIFYLFFIVDMYMDICLFIDFVVFIVSLIYIGIDICYVDGRLDLWVVVNYSVIYRIAVCYTK